jgi:LmbE family N-acetylglucosaminyl deacetylase
LNRILIISAHPDDDILGCGGLLSKIRDAEKSVKVVFLAEGSSCRFPSNEISSNIVSSEIYNRNRCGKKALQYLGVNEFEFYNFPCGRLDTLPIIDINKIIEQEITKFRPDTVFTHSMLDANNDHKIVNKATLMATRPLPNSGINNVYSYEVLSSSEWNFGGGQFEPNLFVELNEKQVSEKIHALKIYASEMRDYPFPRSGEGVRINCQYRGMQVGVKYAEAFRVLRSTIT